MRKVYKNLFEAQTEALNLSYIRGEEYYVINYYNKGYVLWSESFYYRELKTGVRWRDRVITRTRELGWSRGLHKEQSEEDNPCPILHKCEVPYRRVF